MRGATVHDAVDEAALQGFRVGGALDSFYIDRSVSAPQFCFRGAACTPFRYSEVIKSIMGQM